MGNLFYDCTPRSKKGLKSIERPHLVDLAPDELVLRKESPSAPFSVMNNTGQWLAFKVQFTVPDKYYVKPGYDVVGPRATKVVEVGLSSSLKRTGTDGEVSDEGGGATVSEDKIRVKSVNVDMDFVTKIENLRQFGSKDDIAKAFREMFESKDKQLVASDLASVRIAGAPPLPNVASS